MNALVKYISFDLTLIFFSAQIYFYKHTHLNNERNAGDTYVVEFRINGSLDHERGKNLYRILLMCPSCEFSLSRRTKPVWRRNNSVSIQTGIATIACDNEIT